MNSLFITVFISFSYLTVLSPLMAQTDSITNERIPIKAEQLESHWNVNCLDSLTKAKQILSKIDSFSVDTSTLENDIKKCMYIYNTPGTAHFQATPDFKQLYYNLNQHLN